MASQQLPGDPKPLIMDSQQPPAYSKIIHISLEKYANGFTATSWRLLWRNKLVHSSLLQLPKPSIFHWKIMQMAWQQLPGESKPSIMASQQLLGDSTTIDISKETCANCFTTASWRFQTLNPPTPQELERVGPQTKHRIRRLLRARAYQTPDKALKPAST